MKIFDKDKSANEFCISLESVFINPNSQIRKKGKVGRGSLVLSPRGEIVADKSTAEVRGDCRGIAELN